MKREVFELTVGKRFRFNAMNYTVIRPYGEHDNVLGMAENGRVVKFPVYMACEALPDLDVDATSLGNHANGSVFRIGDDKSETFQILDNSSAFDEVTCKVLETSEITSFHRNTDVKVLAHGSSNS